MIEELIGYIAGILIAVSFIPQVMKSIKTKRVMFTLIVAFQLLLKLKYEK